MHGRLNVTYNYTLSVTSALDGIGWFRPSPGLYTAVKETRYPFYRRLGGHQDGSGRLREMTPLPKFDPRTVYPLQNR